MALAKGRLTAVIAALLMACAPSAAAADDAALVQSLHQRTSEWVAAQMHVPVPVRTVRMVPEDSPVQEAVLTYADNDLSVRAALFTSWAGLAKRHPFWQMSSVRNLIHESLHLRGSADPLNEEAVDAVAIDMVPAWMAAFLGPDAKPDAGYGTPEDATYPGVRTIRAMSSAATCSRWRSRAARLWRRAYLIATDEYRAQMIAAFPCEAMR